MNSERLKEGFLKLCEALNKALSSIYDDPSIDELTVEDFHQYAVIRYATPDNFYVDFIAKIGKMFTFDDISKDIKKIKLEDIEIPISGVKTLIEMKKTMREKDKQDLVFLYRKLINLSEKT
jgi:hypothetical protein